MLNIFCVTAMDNIPVLKWPSMYFGQVTKKVLQEPLKSLSKKDWYAMGITFYIIFLCLQFAPLTFLLKKKFSKGIFPICSLNRNSLNGHLQHEIKF